MSGGAQPWRPTLFCACALALLISAFLFSHGEGEPSPSSSFHPRTKTELSGRRGPFSVGLPRQAQRFLSAFLRYEVGESGRGVRRRLRQTATAGFAATLLSQAPRAAAGIPPARLGRVSRAALGGEPPRALISGAAARGRREEQFSFVFELGNGVWRASGPGQ